MNAKRILSIVLSLVMLASIFVLGTTAAEVSPYKYVKTSRWSYNDIMYVTEKGLMNGTTADKFAPAETMTRAMVVTVLYRLQGEPAVEYKSTFTDVKNNKWFTDAVIWAAENKIVEGKGNGIFAPTETITREQLATIIMRYAPMEYIITEERADITGYADYKRVHDYAKDALSWANAIGLITGKTADTLAPREGATREQFAKILRCFKEYDSYKYELVYNSPKPLSTYTEKPYELVTDADIYVAVDGNDSNPGTLDKPVATFEKAVELVRELKKTAKDEIKIAFKAGNYGKLNITLTEEDSGTESVPITYCKYGDGEVIFQNGITITKNMFKDIEDSDRSYFTDKYEPDIKKVELEGLMTEGDTLSIDSQLVNNGQRMNQARYPNKTTMGYLETFLTDPVDKVEGKEKQLLLTHPIVKRKFATYHTLENTEIIGHLAHPYMCNVELLKSYDPETGILELYKKPYQGTSNYTNQTSFFSNISEELDCVNEYWVDVNTKTLYVYQPDTDYVITTRGTYITSSADYVNFVGFEFRGSSDGFFNIEAEHVTVELCDMYVGAGKFAIMASGKYITVSECEIANLAGGGIFLEGTLDDIDNIVSGHCVIDNNSIHDFGLKYKVYLPGVRLYNTVGAVISHNEIYNSSHSGIIYGHAAEGDVYMSDKEGGRGIDNVIEYNVLHHLVTAAGDCGAIYSDRSIVNRDNIIRYNIFYDMGTECGAQMSVYHGDAVSGQQIYGNVFYNGGTEAVRSDGRDNIIRDNVFIMRDARTRPLFYNSKYRGMYLGDGNPSVDNLWSSPTWGTFYGSFELIPAEGTQARKLWEARWPQLMLTKTDLDRAAELVDDPDFIINPSYSEIVNNVTFGRMDFDIHEDIALFSKVENNHHYSFDENPIFVNPALGDYSIREGADFADNHFAQIGRY